MSEYDFPTNDLAQYVNLLQGSGSHFRFSRGNCFPLVSRPFGMTHWAPQTDESNWLFSPHSRQLQGIRATHQPSPWIGDYGHFVVMAQTGRPLLSAGNRSSAFRPEEMNARPYYLSVLLRRYSTRMEMTPTERCSVFRFSFPAGEMGRVIFDSFEGASQITVDPDRRMISGFTRANSGGAPENFASYFAAVFDRPFERAAPTQSNRIKEGESRLDGNRLGAIAEFEPGGDSIEMKVGTSFISVEQAIRNLEREIGARSFDEVRDEGEETWNRALAKIAVAGGTGDQRRTFYSCLYRAHLFPRIWYEFDANEHPVHFSPYDGKLHDGVLYTDNGFWDTYRTVYPLLSILLPDRLGEIVQGWTQAAREGGWFPQWASPGYRACMVGTHIDAVIADACVKGIGGFDREAAYAGMIKHASLPGDAAGSYGRLGIEHYLEHGFVPADQFGGATARSLDYAYDDFCISQVADALGRRDDGDRFRERALNYRHSYDAEIGFMRGKNADGSWHEPWDEFTWGGPYVEGGAWQSTWAVPHDPAGLIALMGGPDALTQKLDRMLAQDPRFEVGTYGFEIHEMTEMAAVPFGQYAHSNQPVHHVLYLYTAAGQPHRTQYWVRKVMNELYSPDGFAGDEDNGEMSCWYVLNALGIYPLCPGHPSYVFGSPLFPAARVQLAHGKELIVEASDYGPGRIYVQQISLNEKPLDKLWISHEDLVRGGRLQFTMSDEPAVRNGSEQPEALPFSLSRDGFRPG
ncbi:MAG TPA: GH92 family glycosyl hydrolase [Armatimonadota bacterium]|nr:GH92 family glycosyl hydrolase [Armatimonadota bacterium]